MHEHPGAASPQIEVRAYREGFERLKFMLPSSQNLSCHDLFEAKTTEHGAKSMHDLAIS